MSTGKYRGPREEPDDLGFEVVDDSGYEVIENPKAPPRMPIPPAKPQAAKPLPAKPLPAKPLPAKPLPAKPLPAARVAPAEDPGFEVISTPTPTTKPKQKPKIQVVDDDDDDEETEERPSKKSRTKRNAVVDEDEDDDSDDDRPRKKRKKRPRGADAAPVDEEKTNVMMDWAAPGFILLVGLVMLSVGTWGQAKNPEVAIAHPIVAVIFMVGLQFVTIPITIVALMVIGTIFGIEYGTLTSAIRNLAAMSFLVNGLIAVFQWAGVMFFVYEPVIFFVGVGLFMTLFRLDVWETMVTMFMLNIMSWVLQLIALIIIIAILATAVSRMDQDDLDDPPETGNRPGQVSPRERNNNTRPNTPARKGSGKSKQPMPKFDPNDDDE